MHLEQVDYKQLSSRQKEIFNFQKVAGKLADYGFNCIKLADDWQGADFLAYHKDGDQTLKVQLKARLTIDNKYVGKDVYIVFPHKNNWYLLPHDDLVDRVEGSTSWLRTRSWLERGLYSSASPSRKLLQRLSEFQLH